jgi:hypothetical protein
VVRARHDGRDVRGDRLGLRELPDPVDEFTHPVRPDRPALRRPRAEPVRRLQIGLLEVGEDAARVGGLVLGVQVDLAVLRVDEAVHALARARVGALRVDHQLVVLGQAVQVDAVPVEHRGRVEVLAVQGDGRHRRRDQIDEGGRPRLVRPEPDRGHGAERARALAARLAHGGPQIERDLVPLDGQQSGPLAGLVAGQILSGHGGTPS